MMRERVRLSRSVVGEEEAAAVARVLIEDGYLGMGSEVGRFETELAHFLDVPAEGVATVSSGTAALQLAVQAVVQPGDEVLVPSFTFLSSFQAIYTAGAVPVSCEVSPTTGLLDLEDAARRLTASTRAIMPVHYASFTGDLEAVHAFAKSHGLRVIEDAAHAFGCKHDGKMVGSFGDVTCFSFDGIKNITSGEGGLVVSDDPVVIRRVRDARLLGVEGDSERRLAGERSWEFEVHRPGYRYHMSNLFAAVGRVQLRRLVSEFADQRVVLALEYRRLLKGIDGVTLFDTNLGAVIPHIQPVRILNGRRDALRAALLSANIECGIHYKPNHLLALFGAGAESLPVTEQLYREILSLPLHPGLSIADVARVCETIRSELES